MVTFTDRKSIMAEWDKWREYIASGAKGSWPSDAFESLLDHFDEVIEKAKATEMQKQNTIEVTNDFPYNFYEGGAGNPIGR